MIAPRIKRRRGAPSTLVAPCHTAQPLVPLSDDEMVDRAELPSWTMTEALFWLGGYRSPGYESDRHMQDHFWDAYTQAVIEIEEGVLCRKKVRAGETIFYDTPGNWLAWADRIGPEYIEVDDRMRRALSQMADSPDGTVEEEPQPAASKVTAVRSNGRGRRPGTGGYDSEDMPLVKEMHRLIKSGDASGIQDAALAVADRAPGKGDLASKVKRLYKKYAAKYPPGAGHSL